MEVEMNALSTSKHNQRTGDWKIFGVFILWAVVYLLARLLLEMQAQPSWLRVAIALMPVPVFAWVLWNTSKAVQGMDELERRIQLEALAFAFPMTLLLVMTLGLIEIAVGLNRDDWSYRHVWPTLFVFYFLGLSFARRRYQ
jgi:hypothetical protein